MAERYTLIRVRGETVCLLSLWPDLVAGPTLRQLLENQFFIVLKAADDFGVACREVPPLKALRESLRPFWDSGKRPF